MKCVCSFCFYVNDIVPLTRVLEMLIYGLSFFFFVETQLSDANSQQRIVFAAAVTTRRLHRIFEQARKFIWDVRFVERIFF